MAKKEHYFATLHDAIDGRVGAYTSDVTGAGMFRLLADLANVAKTMAIELAYKEIDTPEERLAIVTAVMGVFDKVSAVIVEKVPIAAIVLTVARNSLVVYVTSVIEQAEESLRPDA